jgi:hypothetical protein
MALDIRQLISQVLEIGKENLARDGYLTPVAFLVTPRDVLLVEVRFQGQEEKQAAYQAVVAAARQHNALAVVTLNDAYYARKDQAEDYYPGKLAAEGASECICAVVSGPDFAPWSVSVPYERTKEGIRFGKEEESSDVQVGLLPDWATGSTRPS